MSQTLVCLSHSLRCAVVFSDELYDTPLAQVCSHNLTLLGITFLRIWMEGKLSRWPKLSSTHISFQNVPAQSWVTIYLGRQGTSLLISAQLLWSVKQKNNQRLLQRPGLLTAAESKMLLPSCKEPKLKGVFIWKLVSLRSLESFEGQWKKENTCWQAQMSAPSYKHQPQYFSQCVYDRIFFHFVRQHTKNRMQVLKKRLYKS